MAEPRAKSKQQAPRQARPANVPDETFIEVSERMAELADATALGAVGATRGGSNPLPPICLDGTLAGSRKGWRFNSSLAHAH